MKLHEQQGLEFHLTAKRGCQHKAGTEDQSFEGFLCKVGHADGSKAAYSW